MIYKDKECFQPFSVNDSENGNDCFDNYPFQRDMDLYCDLLDQLSKMGIEVTAMHTEWAPGQWEMVTEPMQGMFGCVQQTILNALLTMYKYKITNRRLCFWIGQHLSIIEFVYQDVLCSYNFFFTCKEANLQTDAPTAVVTVHNLIGLIVSQSIFSYDCTDNVQIQIAN